jgi:hypothetical protein
METYLYIGSVAHPSISAFFTANLYPEWPTTLIVASSLVTGNETVLDLSPWGARPGVTMGEEYRLRGLRFCRVYEGLTHYPQNLCK